MNSRSQANASCWWTMSSPPAPLCSPAPRLCDRQEPVGWEPLALHIPFLLPPGKTTNHPKVFNGKHPICFQADGVSFYTVSFQIKRRMFFVYKTYLARKLLQLVSQRSCAPCPLMSTCSAVQLPWVLYTQCSAVHLIMQSGFGWENWVALEISPVPFLWKLWHSVSLHRQAPLPCTLMAG